MTERLGIVYTPVEVVDFILHSVDHLLKTEFGQTLGSPGVHIIDPFTGTGTFITRLLQSGLIKPQEMAHKYKHELHANEIVLLAYYIAAINIEAVYHSIMEGVDRPLSAAEGGVSKGGGRPYEPFEGICLTDTFQLYEKEDLVSQMLVDNSARRTRQKALDLRVIIGNPPYSVGQGSANDNNQNVTYPSLDERIRSTYAERSKATLKNALYDSYIRAIRWASDRVGKSGIVGFVTNAGFVESNTADGLRKCLAEEFSSVHVFHLRGNQRTQGETSRREGGKIFGSGSRAPIAITFLVKNPKAKEQGQIFVHDIGDYLNREEKLQKIVDFRSIAGITASDGWQCIVPDEHGDWLKQRDDRFSEHLAMGNKGSAESVKLFANYSHGAKTQRDAWCYNSSKEAVEGNMERMIDFYNQEVERFNSIYPKPTGADDAFTNFDSSKISWSVNLKQDLTKGMAHQFKPGNLAKSIYRPFSKQWLYFSHTFNERLGIMPQIFPTQDINNTVINLPGPGEDRPFSVFISDIIPDLHLLHGGQNFPLYLYDEPTEGAASDLFASDAPKTRTRRDAITKEGLAHFQAAYPGEKIVREDIFYYVYGLLHSPDYRERYADNLSKELPRIPCVKQASDFWAFSKAGRALANLHLNYETVEPYPVEVEMSAQSLAALRYNPQAEWPKAVSKPAGHSGNGQVQSPAEGATDSLYRVEKMRYGKTRRDGKSVDDKSILVYNDFVTLRGIPLEAYDYVVNGKSALDWVVERQCVKTDKDSGIENDANLWATETMENPKYPLELFQRVITVSLETMKIVNGLPGLEIDG
jgi:predicted helicase